MGVAGNSNGAQLLRGNAELFIQLLVKPGWEVTLKLLFILVPIPVSFVFHLLGVEDKRVCAGVFSGLWR